MHYRTMIAALVTGVVCLAAHNARGQEREDENEARAGRADFEQMRLCDPETRCIPDNIRARELEFASRATPSWFLRTGIATGEQIADWTARGPSNVGGRTRALGIDVANENIILAGGTSGGMWRSTDRGASWARTTLLSELPGTTCLAQDTRPGKTHTWYYGTGELGGNTAAYPLWLNNGPYKGGQYFGNGVFKSTDNGLTWNVLPSTRGDTLGALVQPFNVVNALAIDRSNSAEDVVYAAVAGGIERSSDGGAQWSLVLGEFPHGPGFTDVAVTSHGVVYAILGAFTVDYQSQPTAGLFRSADGIHWVNITPQGWQHAGTRPRYVTCAIAPSNENVVYAGFTDSEKALLWKYTYLGGDGTAAGGVCEDRSANVPPLPFVVYLKVKPDDDNVVFLGGTQLYLSTDGFATPDHASNLWVPHEDQTALAFFPSDPSAMIVGSDGGLFLTESNLPGTVQWIPLNSNYVTTQFYTVAIDHASPGDATIIGGLQDNGTLSTTSLHADDPWQPAYGADGGTCAIAPLSRAYYLSSQWGTTYSLDPNNFNRSRIDPPGTGTRLFVNPFCLDPTQPDCMYFGGGNYLWRQDSLHAIPPNQDYMPMQGWTKLGQTGVSTVGTIDTMSLISFIAASVSPAHRIYFGTTDGQVFRIDSATGADPVSTPVWINRGFPGSAYVSAIAIDPADADNVVVAFANYHVQSLFSSTDGGFTWAPIGGNLEEFPDGSGSGPSIRTAAIMHSARGMVYLIGTSTGLYSTTVLDGMSTVWSLEGANTIGNSIVNMIDVRESDGMVVAATCGHGVFSGRIPAVASVIETPSPALRAQNFPNPFSNETEIAFDLARGGFVTLTVYDMMGRSVATLVAAGQSAGHHSVTWNVSRVQAGSYYCRLTSGGNALVRPVLVAR